MKYKYQFYKNRKEILKQSAVDNYWINVPRKNILHQQDGFYQLMYPYVMNIGKTVLDRFGAFPEQFYCDEDRTLYFTVKINKIKQHVSDNYLESISEITVPMYSGDNSLFKLCPYIMNKSTRWNIKYLTLLYKEFDENGGE